MNRYVAIIIVALLIMGVVAITRSKSQNVSRTTTRLTEQPTQSQPTEKAQVKGGESMQFNEPPAMKIDASKTYTAILKTEKGDITVQLNAKSTPKTVNNFVFLARKGFYSNVIFHRVIEGFMIQSGDPTGTGRGGPGYTFDDESFTGKYTRGTVAMANSGTNTNGSQFFIMHQDGNLPLNYVIFGKVTKGLEVVDKIATADVSMSASGEKSQPVDPISIKSVEIVEK